MARVFVFELAALSIRTAPTRSLIPGPFIDLYDRKCHYFFRSLLSSSAQTGSILCQLGRWSSGRNALHFHLWTVLRCHRDCGQLLYRQYPWAGLGHLQISKVPKNLAHCLAASLETNVEAPRFSPFAGVKTHKVLPRAKGEVCRFCLPTGVDLLRPIEIKN